jgi:hypothetical protein
MNTNTSSLPDELPPQRDIEHEIETGDAVPVNTRAYQLSSQQLKEQTKQIAELLEKGLIRESMSSWGSPVLFVKKANGRWRMCLDYQGLNLKTRKNTYPLPLIQECIDQMGNAIRMSTLDLTRPFVIETDASDFAIGSCLLQQTENGKLHPVAHESRKLSDAQTRYPVHDKELLAIKQALLGWHRCLDNGHRITIYTDHESLKYMNTIKRPLVRLTRWIDKFQMYDLDIR